MYRRKFVEVVLPLETINCEAAREKSIRHGHPPGLHRRLTVTEVRAHRDEIAVAARSHGVRQVRVFGSVARGEATDDSDLDLLVDVEPGTGMFR